MLVAERGASRHTVDAYRRDLADAQVFLRARKLHDATTEDLRAYLRDLNARAMAPATVARRLSSLRQFYAFLVLEQKRADNPTSTLDAPRGRRPLPKVLTEQDVLTLLTTAQDWPGPEGRRLEALLEILYASGLRVSELISLPLSAGARGDAFLVVRGKGNKERLVPLNGPSLAALGKYRAVRGHFLEHPQAKSPWLFPSRGEGGHVTRQRFGQLLKELALKANLDPAKVSPHVLRHAFATHLLNHGADLLSVQKMLGHSDVSTTQIYTHVVEARKRALLEKNHPLAQGASCDTPGTRKDSP